MVVNRPLFGVDAILNSSLDTSVVVPIKDDLASADLNIDNMSHEEFIKDENEDDEDEIRMARPTTPDALKEKLNLVSGFMGHMPNTAKRFK